MATDKYTKSGLMRQSKADLLKLAEHIEFITDKNTKSEIADAILIMSLPAFAADEGPGKSLGLATPAKSPGPRGGGKTKWEPGIDDPNYPKSIKIQRILDSQKES